MSNQQENKKIGVGVVGASSANPGWAVFAHLPAIQNLPDYELRAVSTSRRDSADAAAKEFGVAGYDNYNDMIHDPNVDLIVIATNVDTHYDIALAAIEAGKMVFSEWPLGVTTDEAQELAARAKAKGVRTMVGMQARFSPAIQYARDLIREGYIGEVMSTTMNGTSLIWGPVTPKKFAYTYDVTKGATLLSSPTLHAIDGLNYVLGDFENVAAKFAIRFPEAKVLEDESTVKVTAPTHLAITGTLTGGALATVVYRGETSRDVDLRWEINGSKGQLVIIAENNGNIQNTALKLFGGAGEQTSLSEMEVPDRYTDIVKDIPESPAKFGNVGYVYASFAKDLREGTNITPDFAHAVKRHRLADTIVKANETGIAQKVDNADPQ
ncbi:Gfo/Idh/MocA family protein [Paenibacillus sacheonensis]|uniref:Gfo/Idh/MocA family oxidoreductase n=1 Tax=Paenibacillus sacheonensis TaxID=742054 RepID=A0A7X4YWJ6_9BACL|nr:Gfo/Idh/MocA family oxidoreductase [Paenibacillus sacheonensis]MBM7569072.1 putative dehydrogenase [Paenibacillus sacheonensis]NBC72749.1 Gfo/Idh/MocA family oxidoreductase [Paenibacillus sacheonensis]